MKILLVTDSAWLENKLAVLSPELEYCAIVVNNVESAKKVLEQTGLSQELVYPLNELKKCAEELQYDYVLCLQDKAYDFKINRLQVCDIPIEKIVCFAALPNLSNWQTERLLRYYCEHAQEFEIFSTGTSYTETAIDIRQFKRKAVNFATSSQDLYYNFQIAKFAVSCGGGIVNFVMH